MPRASGSPRAAVVCSQAIYQPADLGWNVVAYDGNAETVGTYVLIEGYGIWSVYVLTTSPGNSTLRIHMADENDVADMAVLVISTTIVSASTQHFTFGAPGTTLPLVARKVAFGMRAVIPNNGNATIRIFGRVY